MKVQTIGFYNKNPQPKYEYTSAPKINIAPQFDKITFTSQKSSFISSLQNLAEGYIPACYLEKGLLSSISTWSVINHINQYKGEKKFEFIKFVLKCTDNYKNSPEMQDLINEGLTTKVEIDECLNEMKSHFTSCSIDSIEQPLRRFLFVIDLLKNPDKHIKKSAFDAISSFEEQKYRDKLVMQLANEQGAFELEGFLLKNIGKVFNLRLSDKLHFEIFKELVSNPKHKKINIEPLHKIKDPEVLDEAIGFIFSIKDKENISSRAVLELLNELPAGEKKDKYLDRYKEKYFELTDAETVLSALKESEAPKADDKKLRLIKGIQHNPYGLFHPKLIENAW